MDVIEFIILKYTYENATIPLSKPGLYYGLGMNLKLINSIFQYEDGPLGSESICVLLKWLTLQFLA